MTRVLSIEMSSMAVLHGVDLASLPQVCFGSSDFEGCALSGWICRVFLSLSGEFIFL